MAATSLGNRAVTGKFQYLAVCFHNYFLVNSWADRFTGIVVNYADSSLQFFTGDGTFYTAILYGGPTGTIETNKFLPFEPPANNAGDSAPQRTQLDSLIQKLTSGSSKNKEY